MRNLILKTLQDLEKEKDIEIIYAVENGSRNWGLYSSESDYDIRFVFKRPVKDYLSLKEKKDVIEKTDGILDFMGTDIYKFVKLVLHSNPVTIEWLRSGIVYIDKDSELINYLRGLVQSQFNPIALYHHYRSMGHNNFHKYIDRNNDISYKRYLYSLRGILNAIWVKDVGALPLMNFEKQVLRMDIPKREKDFILDEIIPSKRKGKDKYQIDRVDFMDNYLIKLFQEYGKVVDIARHTIEPDRDIDQLLIEEVVSQ